ncbi:MAG TPA: hypothetical protein VIL95_08825 [Bacillota bacterium]
MRLQSASFSYAVAGVGVVIAVIGWTMTPLPLGYGIVGFGLATFALGLLDLLRTANHS